MAKNRPPLSMILNRLSKPEFSNPEGRRGQRAVRPLNCGRRGLELRSDSPTLGGFEDEVLQTAEIGNLLNTGAEGLEGKAAFRVAMLHAVEDEQAIYQQF